MLQMAFYWFLAFQLLILSAGHGASTLKGPCYSEAGRRARTTCSDIFLLPLTCPYLIPEVPFPSYGGLLLHPPDPVRHVSGETQLSKASAGYMDAHCLMG